MIDDSMNHHAQASSTSPWIHRWTAWSQALCTLALIGLAGYSAALNWESDTASRYVIIALISGLFAALVASRDRQDSFAMLIGVVLGIVVVAGVQAWSTDLLEGTFWERLKSLPRPVWDALWDKDLTGPNRDLTTELLLGLTIWMSAWVSMWVLVRMNLVVLALVPPCTLILVNEHIAHRDNGWIPIAMIALAVLLIVQSRHQSRVQQWRARHLTSGDTVAGRVFIVGLTLAVVISSTMAMSPSAWSQTVLQPMIENASQRATEYRDQVQYWMDDVLGTDLAPARMGNYTNFSDGFSVGGPLNLTDQPEVLVQSNLQQAPYLTARTYDTYTGRGWTTSSAGEFAEEDGSSGKSPELMYNPNWEVALSPQVRSDREPQTIQVTPLSGAPNVVYSVDTYLSANVQTVVRMSWTTVSDEPLTVTPATLNALPPDVQLLSSLLLQSDLRGEATSWGPSATSGNMQQAIEDEVDDLAGRGIEVRWVATSDGVVQTLFISGRLPVFDDVEAVFMRESAPGNAGSYRTTGLTSVATQEQLESAGTAYPAWVTDRYLETGDTVTDRTRDLAFEIVAGETNPYRQALMLEAYLRANIVYDDQVNSPPGDQDLVDYVLFDNRRGYCEHYSASMVVMLRLLGVPAREVVGYSPGDWDAEANAFVYRQNNAHAWVEAYFPGYGWIPFEPTANRPLGEFDVQPMEEGGEQTGDQVQPTAEPTTAPATVPAVPTPNPIDDNTEATPLPTSEDDTSAPPTVIEADDSGPPGWVRPVLIALGAVAIGAAVIGAFWFWGLRGLTPAGGLMKRVQRVAGWLGIRQGPTMTPRELSRRFDREVPAIAPAVRHITKAYEIERFAPHRAGQGLIDDATAAWQQIRRRGLQIWRAARRNRST